MAISESSAGSSSEEKSPVSFTITENIEDTIEELSKIIENLDLGESTCHSDFSQNFSKDTAADFTTRNGGVSNNIHQVCVIITEAAEDNDVVDNIVVNTQANNPRSNSRKEKEKIYVSAREWKVIMSAINHGTEVPVDSRRKVLMGYQYALHQYKKRLQEEKSELRRSRENNSASSRLTRVNLANILDEGLRIGGRGRRMNSKVKVSQTRRDYACIENKRGARLAQSQSIPGRPLLAPIYRWPGLKDPFRFNTNYNVCIRYQLAF
jgi:hypothetical protein